MILGHLLMIQRWHPGFKPHKNEFRKDMVWVRIPRLLLSFTSFIFQVKLEIGQERWSRQIPTCFRRKRRTRREFSLERTRFACICSEVDLSKVLVPSFELQNEVYPVEYEGLKLVRFPCGQYGHCKDQRVLGKDVQVEPIEKHQVVMDDQNHGGGMDEPQGIFGP